jgi:hypothetical protein
MAHSSWARSLSTFPDPCPMTGTITDQQIKSTDEPRGARAVTKIRADKSVTRIRFICAIEI